MLCPHLVIHLLLRDGEKWDIMAVANSERVGGVMQSEWTREIDTTLGQVLLRSDGEALTGLWFMGQAHFGQGLSPTAMAGERPVFRETEAWLARYFGGAVPEGRPALAPEGTDFQRAVWDVLLTIPYGRTRTYGEIAAALTHRLGRNVSARAVGGAVGRNPISLIIPCHRVLGAGGKLTGYAGGLARKTALLQLEGVLPR